MGSRKSDTNSGDDGKNQKDKRETILQRRDRVLGTKSLRYVVDSPEKVPSISGTGNKRRGQILQAQRAHRQRTLDYIAELESEVFRLRHSEASLSSKVKDKECELRQLSVAKGRVEARNAINIFVLLQCLNGQIAPGLWMTPERVADLEKRALSTHPSPFDFSTDTAVDDRFWLASIWNQDPTSPSLQNHDALTRMLFLNFSENIAPTLVTFDGTSNGYRSLVLPLAWEDDLVRCALLAASANHLRFRRPKLTNLALNFQSAAIEKLTYLSKTGICAGKPRAAILAAIVLLLVNGMMNGGSDFELLLNMAKSWIEAMSSKAILKESPFSALHKFLLDQVSMMQIYAQPLLKEQVTILSQYDYCSPDFMAGKFAFNSQMHTIFARLEDAIRQTCAIYSQHIRNNGPPSNIEELLETLKNTVMGIPNHTPGENALAWAYFIAAAESTTAVKRVFFAKRLMGVYERGSFEDVTTAFTVLHQIWAAQGLGDGWTKVLMQIPAVIK